MSELNITATERTPEIQLSAANGVFSMKGESFPEDVSAFYGQVIVAVDQLASALSKPLTVDVAMVYINSSSMKALYRIFDILDNGRDLGKTVSIRWCYLVDDDVMQELGEDCKDRFPDLDLALDAGE